MILSNLHTHTKMCDGKNTAKEMVEAAIHLGFRSLGFSGHGYVWFDKTYNMSSQNMTAYSHMIRGLKADYKGIIDIYHGLENDAAQLHNPSAYDYTIGAVHYLPVEGKYYCVDESEEGLQKSIKEGFGGNAIKLIKAYYEEVVRMAEVSGANICAHFDLVKKFNYGNRYFDESSDEYCEIAVRALERVLARGLILEVNTGALARGLPEPYPSVFLLRRAQKLRARIIVNSDAHSIANLNYGFAEMEQLLSAIGFHEIWGLTAKGFKPMPLENMLSTETRQIN